MCLQHKLEVALVLEHGPFKTLRELYNIFSELGPRTSTSSRPTSQQLHGTRVVLYNLKLRQNGELELALSRDPDINFTDIVIEPVSSDDRCVARRRSTYK